VQIGGTRAIRSRTRIGLPLLGILQPKARGNGGKAAAWHNLTASSPLQAEASRLQAKRDCPSEAPTNQLDDRKCRIGMRCASKVGRRVFMPCAMTIARSLRRDAYRARRFGRLKTASAFCVEAEVRKTFRRQVSGLERSRFHACQRSCAGPG